MNCGLYLTMEADFVDNCLAEGNKTEAVVKIEAKGTDARGTCITCMGEETLSPPPPSLHLPQSHTLQLSAKTKQIFIISTLHTQADKESCSCYRTQRSASTGGFLPGKSEHSGLMGVGGWGGAAATIILDHIKKIPAKSHPGIRTCFINQTKLFNKFSVSKVPALGRCWCHARTFIKNALVRLEDEDDAGRRCLH